MKSKDAVETDAALDAIDALFANAKPIPLTDQVRIDLREAQAMAARLRESLERERDDF